MDGTLLEHVPEFESSGRVLDKSSIDGAECRGKVAAASGRKIEDAVRFLLNVRTPQLECASLPHEALLVPVQM